MKPVPQKHCVIYLMRHGKACLPNLIAGQSDHPLSPEGEAQMNAWAEFFAPIPIDAIWTSPLARARQSAAIIAKALNRPLPDEAVNIAPALMELSLGAWERLSKDEVRKKYPAEWAESSRDFINFAPPGGESFSELSRRTTPFMEGLYKQIINYGHVLIMAHQAVNRSILAALGEPFSRSWLDIPQNYASLNELELSKKRSGAFNCNIIRVNARAPLWLRPA